MADTKQKGLALTPKPTSVSQRGFPDRPKLCKCDRPWADYITEVCVKCGKALP